MRSSSFRRTWTKASLGSIAVAGAIVSYLNLGVPNRFHEVPRATLMMPSQFAEPPSGSSRVRLARSAMVNVAGQIATVAATIGSTMILARILGPSDFGLFAMTGTLTAFIGSFRDFGLPMATLQAKAIDELHASGLFWVNLKVNIGVTLFMIAMAPILAWFYGDHRLIALTCLMSAGTFAAGAANQHEALLTREWRFNLIAAVDFGSFAGATLITLFLALAGAGYWALAAQYILWRSARTSILIFASGWKPLGPRRSAAASESIKEMLSLGRNLTWSRMLAHIGRNIDNVVVGYSAGAHALGLYDAAYKWSTFPIQQIYTPILAVAVAGLSKARADAATYRAACRACLLPVFAVSVPILSYLIIDADRVVLLLLGRKWQAAIPIFRWLCFGSIAAASTMTTKWIYISLGKAARQLRWGLIATPIMIAAIAVGARFGPVGVATAFAAGNWVLFLPAIAFCVHGTPLRVRDYLAVLRYPVLASLPGCAALIIFRTFITIGHSSLAVTVHALLFFSLYIGFWMALPGGRMALGEIVDLIRGGFIRRQRQEESSLRLPA